MVIRVLQPARQVAQQGHLLAPNGFALGVEDIEVVVVVCRHVESHQGGVRSDAHEPARDESTDLQLDWDGTSHECELQCPHRHRLNVRASMAWISSLTASPATAPKGPPMSVASTMMRKYLGC